MSNLPEEWTTSKRVLLILAHPDDPEFFCGATIARWVKEGNEVSCVLLTRGERGGRNNSLDTENLGHIREKEQRAAAEVLGFKTIEFLDLEDGFLEVNLETRRMVARIIREKTPDILVTGDPTNYFPLKTRINHPDHRAAGQIVMDALYPAAGSRLFFPELIEEGLKPHSPQELWLTLTSEPNVIIDVTDYWEVKIDALLKHKSQVGAPDEFIERMRARRTEDSTEEEPRFVEAFRRFRLP